MMEAKISNGLWFDHQAEEAAKFYSDIFKDARMGDVTYYGKEGQEIHGQKAGTVMTASFSIGGIGFVGINGGPIFKPNPSISYFVTCESEQETSELWKHLSENGQVLMELGKYEWSEKYGWVQDRYGISWQVALGKIERTGQKVVPSLMFVGHQHGRAEEAVNFYTGIFKNSHTEGVLKYPKGGDEPEGTVMHAQFRLSGQTFMAMDSAAKHDFQFNEAISIIVNCHTQQEIDYFWEKLGQGGDPAAQQCGWLKDKFGVSWQVDSVRLNEMLKDKDEEKVARVTHAFLRMKKFDMAALERAYEGRAVGAAG